MYFVLFSFVGFFVFFGFVLEFVLYFALFRCSCGFRFVIVICLFMAIFCLCFPLFACVDLVFSPDFMVGIFLFSF